MCVAGGRQGETKYSRGRRVYKNNTPLFHICRCVTVVQNSVEKGTSDGNLIRNRKKLYFYIALYLILRQDQLLLSKNQSMMKSWGAKTPLAPPSLSTPLSTWPYVTRILLGGMQDGVLWGLVSAAFWW